MGGDQGSGRAGTAMGRDSHGCNGSRPPERGGIRAGSPSGRDSRREGKWEGKVKGSLSGEGGFDDQKSSFPRLAIPPVRRRRCARVDDCTLASMRSGWRTRWNGACGEAGWRVSNI